MNALVTLLRTVSTGETDGLSMGNTLLMKSLRSIVSYSISLLLSLLDSLSHSNFHLSFSFLSSFLGLGSPAGFLGFLGLSTDRVLVNPSVASLNLSASSCLCLLSQFHYLLAWWVVDPTPLGSVDNSCCCCFRLLYFLLGFSCFVYTHVLWGPGELPSLLNSKLTLLELMLKTKIWFITHFK